MTTAPAVDDVWVVDFGVPYPSEPAAHRPAIVVGPTAEWGGLPVVIVVPLTTTPRALDFHVEIEPDDENGLVEVSYAQCEAIRSIGSGRLVHRVGSIGWYASAAIAIGVRDLLGY